MSSDDKIGPRDLLLLLDAEEALQRDGMEPVKKMVDSLLAALQQCYEVLSMIADGNDEPEKLARDLIERLGE
jgi:hypothetical protein